MKYKIHIFYSIIRYTPLKNSENHTKIGMVNWIKIKYFFFFCVNIKLISYANSIFQKSLWYINSHQIKPTVMFKKIL